MNEPVRILSDLHLGHKISRIDEVQSLRPLIAGAGTVIFNGDTWQELARPFLERSTAMLAELQTICREERVEAIFLSGNHDPSWPGPGWVELANGKIIVTHGDTLLLDGSPWKREILGNGQRVMELWNEHPRAHLDVEERLRVARKIARELCTVEHVTGRSLFQRALDAVIPPRRALRMLEGWFTQGQIGTQFCEAYFPDAEMLIVGHFHHQGTWRHRRQRTINTGSFMAPGLAHWVEWNAGFLSRGRIDESGQQCLKGEILDVWRVTQE